MKYASNFVKEKLGDAEIAIVLGSGLGDLVEILQDKKVSEFDRRKLSTQKFHSCLRLLLSDTESIYIEVLLVIRKFCVGQEECICTKGIIRCSWPILLISQPSWDANTSLSRIHQEEESKEWRLARWWFLMIIWTGQLSVQFLQFTMIQELEFDILIQLMVILSIYSNLQLIQLKSTTLNYSRVFIVGLLDQLMKPH